MKPSSNKSGKNLFETFFVGEQGTQYFVKPLLMVNEELKEKLYLDITFRYKDTIKDSAIINFSIESTSIYKQLDSLVFSNSEVNLRNKKISLLFNEVKKNQFISRFTTKVSLAELKTLFNKEGWILTIDHSSKSLRFIPDKKTKKRITVLRERLFIIM